FFQAEDGIRARTVTGVQTCALPICMRYTTLVLAGALTLALGGPTARALAADPGLTATEVKIGNTNPYSGPASSYGTIGKAIAARSEERRVGKECRARRAPSAAKKKE